MRFEEPIMPDPKKIARMRTERILSDADLVNGGAEVTPEGLIKATEDQKKDEEVNMGKQLTEENADLNDSLRKEKSKSLKWWQREYGSYKILDDFSDVEAFLETKTEDEIRQLQQNRREDAYSRLKGTRFIANPIFENLRETIQIRLTEYFARKEALEEWLEKKGFDKLGA